MVFCSIVLTSSTATGMVGRSVVQHARLNEDGMSRHLTLELQALTGQWWSAVFAHCLSL